MIGVIDVIDEVIALLLSSQLNGEISGTIGTDRFLNSTTEDITVNSLPLSGGQLQRAVVNVNLHVPNLKIADDNGVDTYIVNRPRFRELASLMQEALNERVTNKVYTSIVNCQLIKEEYSSYMNYRIEIKGKNLK